MATEQAIAASIDRLAAQPGPAIAERDVTEAVLAKGEEIGHRLTPGQWDVVESVCSSGRAVEVVVGVAGSGKTTALDAATAALGRHGYRVLGASTSGQAARTLGDEAHIESRTITS
ncbi:MAG TPA: AAA family ATPase, partial [Iamia sp.]|nr:AAA family ATPase [Iamia sp.]